MKERPILMNGEMVRAVLDGRKTVTRRPVDPQPLGGCLLHGPNIYGNWEPMTGRTDVDEDAGAAAGQDEWSCPFGTVGDRLWVRETWKTCRMPAGYSAGYGVAFQQDDKRVPVPSHIPVEYGAPWNIDAPWRPSIHMPRWASRITLEITGVRVERAQEIKEESAKAEGVKSCTVGGTSEAGTPFGFVTGFAVVWDGIYAERGLGWNVNPWVWCVAFRRLP
jgi:hypothetical protein